MSIRSLNEFWTELPQMNYLTMLTRMRVAYFIWCRLTSILFVCGWKPEELAKEVHETALSDAEPEGAA